ncbi:MAG TPA: hypothetical protein VMR76_01655 [Candidatus Saccharimonadia bacterium]|nr:hypothetical protein [Candidatus Saccharimonadia bacterium]
MPEEKNFQNIDTILQHISSLLAKESDQLLLEQFGIGYAQYRVLILLKLDKPMIQMKLAQDLLQSEPSVSRQMKLLESKLLITRYLDPINKKVRCVCLTQLGFRLISSAKILIVRRNLKLLEDINKRSKIQLVTSLNTLSDLVLKNNL